MELLALLLVFPIAWPFVSKLFWKHNITASEMALNIAGGVLVVVIGWSASYYQSTGDYQILNGQVTGKESVRVSCEHSYSCNCREECSGSRENKTCSTVCDTCYDHSYDVDHLLRTTLGVIEIQRVNRQGTIVPERFKKAQIGDPVAKTSSYTNYIKAAPDSLFHHLQSHDFLNQFGAMPKYPWDVYDYHYVDRVLTTGRVKLNDHAQWNADLANSLRELGALKQVNFVVVITDQLNPLYSEVLAASWLGGKKNDVIVVLGAPEYPKLSWARVISWTDNQLFKQQLTVALNALKTIERTEVIPLLTKHVSDSFERKPMADFEYLRGSVKPPLWLMGVLLLLSVLTSIGISIVMAKNDITTQS